MLKTLKRKGSTRNLDNFSLKKLKRSRSRPKTARSSKRGSVILKSRGKRRRRLRTAR